MTTFFRALLASACMGLVIWKLAENPWMEMWLGTRGGKFLQVGIPVFGGILTFLVVGALLGLKELRVIAGILDPRRRR